MRRLLPDAGTVDVEELIAGLALGDRAPDERPYAIANFVASADGAATVDGTSGGLGSPGDRAIFHALRGTVDAVLVGTGTLRAETYGLLARRPEIRALRARLGLELQPIACTVTRSGAVPTDIPLLAEPDARMIVYSAAEVDLGAPRAAVEVIRWGAEQLTVARALADLRARHGVRLLLCEGGPTVLSEMVRQSVLDELFLTVAPKLAGDGDRLRITRDLALSTVLPLRTEWVLEQDGSLFVRYAIDN